MPAYFWIAVVLAAVALDFAVMRFMRNFWLLDDSGGPRIRVFGAYSPVLTWLRYRRLPVLDRAGLAAAWRRIPFTILAEFALLTVWAFWVGRQYANLDPNVWVGGGDWLMNLQGYYGWELVKKCGACFLWNGTLNGGAPLFVELMGAILHPVIVVGILLWGVVNASKMALLAGLLTAGLGQWWMARALRLGVAARLWAAGMAVAGGHLAGRLHNGLVEAVLSVGACSLVIAAGLELAQRGRRRTVVAAGVLLGLAILAGQGYMQIAMVAGIFPGFAFFLFDSRLRIRPLWRSFAWAVVIALLISAVFWAPFLHFWPNFHKPTTDADYADVPPLDGMLLNLVIRDREIYGNLEQVGLPFSPAWYVNYIGWVAIALALLAVPLLARKQPRVLLFFLSGTALVYLLGSATALRWLTHIAPNLVTTIRTPSFMTSMAVPLILGLAAWGLDHIVKANWPSLELTRASRVFGALSLKWLALALPLGWSLAAAHAFGQEWLYTAGPPPPISPIVPADELVDKQWVSVPMGESGIALAAVQAGLKATRVVRPWYWEGRESPAAHFVLTREEVDTTLPNYAGTEHGLNKMVYPENEYAFVETGSQRVPCRALAQGGNIDVDCEHDTAGVLVVYENSWSGWTVTRDDARARLLPGQWLSVTAPAGTHHYEFRYRPWDVPLGLALTISGVALAVWVWRAPRRRVAAKAARPN